MKEFLGFSGKDLEKLKKISTQPSNFNFIFSGLIPRLLFEASSIALANGIAYVIKTYIFDEKEINIMTDLFSSVT